MKIINEFVDNELYIDFVCEPKDLKALNECATEPMTLNIFNKSVNVWIRSATQREIDEDDE